MNRPQLRLGEILKSKGLITEAQLQSALQEHTTKGEFLGIILVKHGAISEACLIDALAEQFALPVIRLKDRYIDWELVRRFSVSLLLEHGCFPVTQETWSITVAVLNPLDAWSIKKAEEEAFPLRVKLVLTYREDMEDASQRYRQYLKGIISKQ